MPAVFTNENIFLVSSLICWSCKGEAYLEAASVQVLVCNSGVI